MRATYNHRLGPSHRPEWQEVNLLLMRPLGRMPREDGGHDARDALPRADAHRCGHVRARLRLLNLRLAVLYSVLLTELESALNFDIRGFPATPRTRNSEGFYARLVRYTGQSTIQG